MAILVKQSGITSGTAPDTLTNEPFCIAGSVYYVDSTSANASDANTGLLEEFPKATVFGASGAMTAVTDTYSDVIVCAAAHKETVSSAYTFAKSAVSIVGRGAGSARPTFTSSVAGVMLAMGAQVNVRFENLIFAASTAATTARISGLAIGNEVRDCHFYCGVNDTGDCILASASNAGVRVLGCTFTVSASGAQRGLKVSSSASSDGILVEDCVFDGGSYGWQGAAFSITAAALGWRIRNLTLSNYSDLTITTTGSKGYISGMTIDATSSWQWNP